MKNGIRYAIWKRVRGKLPEGSMLPWWAVLVWAVLFPLDFFYWRMSESKGYQMETDTWLIHGVRYSGRALLSLANAQGETYRIWRKGDVVTLERINGRQR